VNGLCFLQAPAPNMRQKHGFLWFWSYSVLRRARIEFHGHISVNTRKPCHILHDIGRVYYLFILAPGRLNYSQFVRHLGGPDLAYDAPFNRDHRRLCCSHLSPTAWMYYDHKRFVFASINYRRGNSQRTYVDG
jgi:hypothetical protein